MAADWRTLKLEVLAETKQFVKGMGEANKQTETLGDKINDFSKKAAIALAAAAAAAAAFAIKLGKDSVQAAIKAEAEQNRLNQILLTTNGATRAQIELLNQQANALERVGVVSGSNIKVVQSQLATFDLSFATIRRLTPAILDYVTAEKGASASAEDFKAATNGLAQALNGNFTSLTRTGFVLDDTTKSLIENGTESERSAALVSVLNSTYKDFNATLLNTAEGQLQAVKNQFDNLKVTIGLALLPIFKDFMVFISTTVIPVLQDKVIPVVETFIRRLSGQKGLSESLTQSQETAIKWADNIRTFIKIVVKLKDEILVLGAALTAVFVVNRIAAGVAAIITFINVLRKGLAALRASAMIAGVAQAFALNPLLGVGAVALGVGVMAAAKAAFGGDDAPVSGSGGGSGGNTVPLGSLPQGFTSSVAKATGGATASAGTTAGTTGGTTGGTSAGSTASSVSSLNDRIINLDAEFNAQQAAQAKDAQIRDAQFNRLIEVMSQRATADQGVVINVNSPSIIDETGFTRAVQLAIQSTQERGAGGYGFQLIQ